MTASASSISVLGGGRNGSRGGRPSRAVLLTCALLAGLIPVDFVQVTQTWLYVSLASLILGAAVALRALNKHALRVVWVTVIFIFFSLAFNQLMRFNPIGFVTLLAPVVVGAGLAVSSRRPLAILAGAAVVVASTMGIESLVGEHIFGQLFGSDNYVAYAQDTFRSRGIIGQPVPASMLAVALGAGALVLSSRLSHRRVLFRSVVVIATAVSVFSSGTRSAVICALALTIVLWLAKYLHSRSDSLRIGRNSAWIVPFAIAVSVMVVTVTWSSLSNQRVFSFATLSGSDSLDNRNYAALVFQDWVANCNGVCPIFGSGARDLLETLSSGLGFRGFTTVDNLFLSLLWDFGIIVLVGLLFLVLFSMRVLVKSGSPEKRAGAVMVIAIFASGVFYDSLYIRPVLLLFGFGVGLMGLKVTESENLDYENQSTH